MDIGQLHAFERIVREGSFSRAARALTISQPAISARVAALEREIGGPLFRRGGRTLELTTRGEAFLPFARRALDVLGAGVEAAQLAEAGQRGRLTLGLLESLTGGVFASAVARFARTHAQVEIFMRTGHSDQIVTMLDDGLARLGVIIWPFYGAELTPLLRFREPLTLIARAGHPLVEQATQSATAGATVTLADVARLADPFWLVRWNPAVSTLAARLGAMGCRVAEVPAPTARTLLLRGMGAALLTDAVVADELADGRLVRGTIRDAVPLDRESALVRLARGGPLPVTAQAFVRIVREEAGALVLPEAGHVREGQRGQG
jgi:DNA-binding transcriptional LysR family regulator